MRRPEGGAGRSFPELPLVLFTALVTAGAGVGASHLTLAALGWVPWALPPREAGVVAGLLGLGVAVSVGHLGRPLRGPLALARIGVSSLSNEVLVVGGTVFACLAAWVLPSGHLLAVPASLAAQLGCVLSLLALGLVYRLPGQLTWHGSVLVQPLLMGVCLGITYLMQVLPAGAQARGELVILLILFLDGLALWERSRRMGIALARGRPVHPRLADKRGAAFTARIILGVLAPAATLLQGWRDFTLFSLSVSLVLDRFLFYGLAVRATTESEISRVETLLRSRALSSSGATSPAPIPAHEQEE